MQTDMSLQVSSLVGDVGLLWKNKNKNNQIIIQKIIDLDKGGHAIILKNDCNKPIRFLYLCLLMSKKNSYNISTLISKMNQICQKTQEIIFLGMEEKMEKIIGTNSDFIYRNLLELNRKMEKNKYSQIYILKLIVQFPEIDYLLIMVLRSIADEYKMVNALDCQQTLTLGQIELLLSKIFS